MDSCYKHNSHWEWVKFCESIQVHFILWNWTFINWFSWRQIKIVGYWIFDYWWYIENDWWFWGWWKSDIQNSSPLEMCLNIVTTDIKTGVFKKVSMQIFAKLSALWNNQSQSTLAPKSSWDSFCYSTLYQMELCLWCRISSEQNCIHSPRWN